MTLAMARRAAPRCGAQHPAQQKSSSAMSTTTKPMAAMMIRMAAILNRSSCRRGRLQLQRRFTKLVNFAVCGHREAHAFTPLAPAAPKWMEAWSGRPPGRGGALVDVYVHTDRAWTRPPSGSAYSARAFWSGQLRNLSTLRERWDCCWRAPSNIDSCFKYDGLLQVSARHRRARGDSWTGVLADSDVLFQCSAQELRERFRRFSSPLVVSGERRWYPIPRNFADPFGPPQSLSWKARYQLRHTRQFYPNSGLIIGTSAGFEALASAVKATPKFPCCAFEGDGNGFQLDPCSSCRPIRRFPAPVACTVEDQACMQVALASRRAPAHVVDVNASLFLNLNELTPADLVRSEDGRIAFRHSGAVPCVLHSNGHKGILSFLEPHLQTAAWTLTPKRAADAKGLAREREAWQNGAWRQFRIGQAGHR